MWPLLLSLEFVLCIVLLFLFVLWGLLVSFRKTYFLLCSIFRVAVFALFVLVVCVVCVCFFFGGVCLSFGFVQCLLSVVYDCFVSCVRLFCHFMFMFLFVCLFVFVFVLCCVCLC